MADLNHDRRTTRRVHKHINAQYCLENQMLYSECIIVDFSTKGAAVKIDKHEKVNTGAKIFLEIFISDGFKQVNLKGIIKRVEKTENGIVCGVKFFSKLDQNTFSKL